MQNVSERRQSVTQKLIMHRMEIMNAGEMTHSQGIRESPREDRALGNRIEVKVGKDSR